MMQGEAKTTRVYCLRSLTQQKWSHLYVKSYELKSPRGAQNFQKKELS